MTPAIFNNDGCQKTKNSEMNGSCPSSILKMNSNSRIIHKPLSSSSSSTSSFSSSSNKVTKNRKTLKRPVIIYTQPPKIIHTEPRNFMALVQKLTGISRDDGDDDDRTEAYSNPPYERQQENNPDNTIFSRPVGQEDDNESSSAITEDCNLGAASDAQIGSSFVSYDDIPMICSNSVVFSGSCEANRDILSL